MPTATSLPSVAASSSLILKPFAFSNADMLDSKPCSLLLRERAEGDTSCAPNIGRAASYILGRSSDAVTKMSVSAGMYLAALEACAGPDTRRETNGIGP